MGYRKHQLYLNDYEVKDGVVLLPKECYWKVQRQIGGRMFTKLDEEEKGRICLILNQDYSDTRGFWSVMSFLTNEEARKLRDQLDQAITSV